MNKNTYKQLFTPGQIGSLALKNRIVVTAMGVSFAEEDGAWSDRIRAYHEEQAKGGAALIIAGATSVGWPVGGVQKCQVALSEDRHIPGLKVVVDSVHRHGAKFAVQLHHAGQNGMIDLLEGRPLWVPSVQEPKAGGYPDYILPEEFGNSPFAGIKGLNYKELSHADIQTVVAQFAAAAGRAKKAGVDGIEIHGGHGYILSSFLSPSSNKRTDEYGGTVEKRARLLLEVVAAIRAEVGAEYPLWVKLDSRELLKDDGIKIEDALETAKLVETAGVDAITVTAYHNTTKGGLDTTSNIPMIPAVNLPFAARIKVVVNIPVIASGRVEPYVAEDTLAQNKADFIAFGRKILADPAFPEKLKNGQESAIRPCIYCYTCVSSVVYGNAVRCAVNPDMGQEYKTSGLITSSRKHIAVIGGGPGGMETARRLSLAGYRVTLLEQGAYLGGTLRFASIAYGANEKLMDWLIEQLKQSDVEVQLNIQATPELIRQMNVDAVVVATGAIRTLPEIEGNDLPHVFSGDDMRKLVLGESSESLKAKTSILTRLATKVGAATGATANPELVRKASKQWMPLGKQIVIIGADLVGLELAEFLAERGRTVNVIDEKPAVGVGLPVVRRVGVMVDLQELGVVIHPNAGDIKIEADRVYYTVDGKILSAPADNVIVAKGATGNLELANQLKGEGFTTFTVGDCNGVGYIDGAMSSAVQTVANVHALMQQ